MEDNGKGKYSKEQLIKNGYKIINYGMTATEIKKDFDIEIPKNRRIELSMGFVTGKGWRGYAPAFDIAKIFEMYENGEL